MRRALPALLVVGLVVLAGCLGGLTGDGDDPEPELESNGEDDVDDETDGDDEDETDGDGDLEIHHLDVGQADATLLRTPAGETVLIDSGDWRDDGEAVVDALEAEGIDRIDHLVATHAHADHVGGHAAVIEHLEERGEGVGAAYDSGVVHTSATYERYLDAIERHDVGLFEVRAGDELPVAGVDVHVLNPPEGEPGDDLHANSVVLAIEHGEVRYVTTGDAEADVESRLVDERSEDLDADVYQAGHHGSSTSSSEPFLEAVSPGVAVISSAQDSQYGHPHDETLEAFAERGIETYWTGVHGDVVVTTDGESVAVETEREAPTDPAELLELKPDDDESAALPGPAAGAVASAALGVARPSIHVAGARTAGR